MILNSVPEAKVAVNGMDDAKRNRTVGAQEDSSAAIALTLDRGVNDSLALVSGHRMNYAATASDFPRWLRLPPDQRER